jgi:hypothetical protein
MPSKYPQELKTRTVPMVLDHQDRYESRFGGVREKSGVAQLDREHRERIRANEVVKAGGCRRSRLPGVAFLGLVWAWWAEGSVAWLATSLQVTLTSRC